MTAEEIAAVELYWKARESYLNCRWTEEERKVARLQELLRQVLNNNHIPPGLRNEIETSLDSYDCPFPMDDDVKKNYRA